MQLLRLAAVACFFVAALGGFGWLVHADVHVLLGLLAAGLALLAASGLVIPTPPTR